jgi:hypothetical protein
MLYTFSDGGGIHAAYTHHIHLIGDFVLFERNVGPADVMKSELSSVWPPVIRWCKMCGSLFFVLFRCKNDDDASVVVSALFIVECHARASTHARTVLLELTDKRTDWKMRDAIPRV